MPVHWMPFLVWIIVTADDNQRVRGTDRFQQNRAQQSAKSRTTGRQTPRLIGGPCGDVDTGRLSGGVPVTAKPRTRTGPRADCISLPVHWGILPIGTLTSSIGETAPLDEPD